MQYISCYKSPLGSMLLAADEIGVIGIWFDSQKHFARCLEDGAQEKEISLLKDVKKWLDIYFRGEEPDFSIPLHLMGTPFQKEVWEILQTIPYGVTTTYGAIARQIAAKKGMRTMSAQAVGGAVGRNPISVLIPCHRVIGRKGNLTGYAGGIEKKIKLLELEKAGRGDEDGNSQISKHRL